MRDYALGTTFDIKFTTRQVSGAPFTLAGTPVISAYPDNSTTELTAGITLTVDFDTRTGLNNVRVVATSGNGYASGSNYALVITTGTVNSVSVVGEVVGEFSLEAQSPLRPTTAGRTLDVSAGGEAGLDWANIGSPTTAQNLSATNIDVDQIVASVSGAVGSIGTGGISAGSFAAGAIDAAAIADNAIDAGSIAADAITAAKIATGAIDADAIALSAADEILGAVSGTADSGTTTTVVDTERTEADTDYWVGSLITFTSGTLNGQTRLITAFNAATDTLTFAPATTVAAGTHTYRLIPHGRVDVHLWLGALVNALISGRVDANAQVVGDKTGYSIGVGGIAATSFAAGAIDAAAIADNAIDAGALAANTITAAKIATDAIGAAQLAADAVDEIWDEAMTELAQAAPSATPAMRALLSMLYMMARNQITVTSTFKTFSNDAGTVVFKKALTDDGTTFTEAEAVTGP